MVKLEDIGAENAEFEKFAWSEYLHFNSQFQRRLKIKGHLNRQFFNSAVGLGQGEITRPIIWPSYANLSFGHPKWWYSY